jgi:hypothetical protein
MTKREIQITKALLEVLHGLDGGQLNEIILHAEVNLRISPTATLSEFNASLVVADSHGWLIGVNSEFSGRLWNLSDKGESARMRMLKAQ